LITAVPFGRFKTNRCFWFVSLFMKCRCHLPPFWGSRYTYALFRLPPRRSTRSRTRSCLTIEGFGVKEVSTPPWVLGFAHQVSKWFHHSRLPKTRQGLDFSLTYRPTPTTPPRRCLESGSTRPRADGPGRKQRHGGRPPPPPLGRPAGGRVLFCPHLRRQPAVDRPQRGGADPLRQRL